MLAGLSALVWIADCIWLLHLFFGWMGGAQVWPAWVYAVSIAVLPVGLFLMFSGMFADELKDGGDGSGQRDRARGCVLGTTLLGPLRLAAGFSLTLLSFPACLYILQLLIWGSDGIFRPWWHMAISVAIPVAAVLTRVPQEGRAHYHSPEQVAERERKRLEWEARRSEREANDAARRDERERAELRRLGCICPRCGSGDVMHIGTKGRFSLSRAGLGYMMFGSKGFLAGALLPEEGKRVFRCLNCGKKYKVR